MQAETADERRNAAEWAAIDLKSGMGWELEVEVEVESGTGGGERAAEAGVEGGGVATLGWTKVERM